MCVEVRVRVRVRILCFCVRVVFEGFQEGEILGRLKRATPNFGQLFSAEILKNHTHF